MSKCLFALIPFAISIFLFVNGFSTLNEAQNINVPELGGENWFELSTKQSELKAIGAMQLAFGFFCFIVTLIVFATIIVAEKQKRKVNKMNENIAKSMKNSLASEKENSEPKVKCEYCGATYPKDLDKCPCCGARTKWK